MSKLLPLLQGARVIDGASLDRDTELHADVCVIGSGAGGAVVASVLASRGHDVLLVEEGGLHTAREFSMREADCASMLYQDGMQRATDDGAISILQGRAVGGGTVVNWTTSFRTPEDIVDHWARNHGVTGWHYRDLAPHYEAIEARLAVRKVDASEMNANNRVLFDGCKTLGWHVDTIARNVHACLQSGYCGLGCPVNAKRSMLVTTVPDMLESGGRLLTRCRVERLERTFGRVERAHGVFLDHGGYALTGRRVTVRAKRFVVSAGAINSPALLLRSGIDDAGRVGRRTFLHPVVASLATYDDPIHAYSGAPQSVASMEFARRNDGMGVFLEAAPWHPSLGATVTRGFGADHARRMETLPRTAFHIGLTIDGFHGDEGGHVSVRASGSPALSYPLGNVHFEALSFAAQRLAEAQLASGAREVTTLHDPPYVIRRRSEVAAIANRRWAPSAVAIFSAHQMGGCPMGDDPRTSVVRSEDLRHHTTTNLHVIDGSVFPTAVGVNPQHSIYGLARLMATRLAEAS